MNLDDLWPHADNIQSRLASLFCSVQTGKQLRLLCLYRTGKSCLVWNGISCLTQGWFIRFDRVYFWELEIYFWSWGCESWIFMWRLVINNFLMQISNTVQILCFCAFLIIKNLIFLKFWGGVATKQCMGKVYWHNFCNFSWILYNVTFLTEAVHAKNCENSICKLR
jgi:hypothetical protein